MISCVDKSDSPVYEGPLKELKMKLLVSLLFALLVPAMSYAWWTPQVQHSVTPYYVQAQVNNPSPYPVFCQGYVYGNTQMGQSVYAWFTSTVPGYGYAYAYVYANPPYIFVSAWSEIYCMKNFETSSGM